MAAFLVGLVGYGVSILAIGGLVAALYDGYRAYGSWTGKSPDGLSAHENMRMAFNCLLVALFLPVLTAGLVWLVS